jgi:serine/threonine protein kinase
MADAPPSQVAEPAVPSTAPAPVEWPTNPAAYELIGKIGQGAFATVWKARIPETNAVCAVKVLVSQSLVCPYDSIGNIRFIPLTLLLLLLALLHHHI